MLVLGSVIQATGIVEFEDGLRASGALMAIATHLAQSAPQTPLW